MRCIIPLLYLATSIFLLFDSIFIGSFRQSLKPVNGRIVDIIVGAFIALTMGKLL